MSHIPFFYSTETMGAPPEREKTEKILRAVADRIIKLTTFRFAEPGEKQAFAPEDKDTFSESMIMESGYNDWKYWNGVILTAFKRLSQNLDDAQYTDFGKKWFAFAEKCLPVLEKHYNHVTEKGPFHQYFRLDRLDDFGAMVCGLLDVYENTPPDTWNKYLERVDQYLMEEQDRLDDGTFCRIAFDYTTLWGDDLYMSVPYLARRWQITKDKRYLKDAIKQVKNFSNYLFNEHKELMAHCRYYNLNRNGVAHWGRANGWMVLGQCELLDVMPDDHSEKEELKNLLIKHLLGLSRYQNERGLWHQLIDKSDSFEETSCTAMFCYGFAHAINSGWLEDIYSSVAISAWLGLQKFINNEGYVDNVTTGFNIRQDLPYYYNRPVEIGGDHGLGAVMLAGIEILKLREYRDGVWS